MDQAYPEHLTRTGDCMNTNENTAKFRPGDRVVHVTASNLPEGIEGTVLGPAVGYPGRWEVEYEGHPCTDYGRSGAYGWAKSKTSWFSRETSIELTREEAMKRAQEAASV
jgi:hypothetical protein